jgi:hypothetical protein
MMEIVWMCMARDDKVVLGEKFEMGRDGDEILDAWDGLEFMYGCSDGWFTRPLWCLVAA